MKDHDRTGQTGAALVLVGVLVLLTGCAHVNQEQFAAEMDALRQEMQAEDQAVEDRVSDRLDGMSGDLDGRITALADELGELRGEFEVTVERLESAVRFNTPIHFAFDDETVQSEDEAVLDRFASVVTAYYEDATLTVEGFTDPAGSTQYNLALGERRAEAVKGYLQTAGIPAERMRTVSYGEAPDRQIAPDTQGPGEMGWQNRRVAIVIDFSQAMDGPSVASN